MPQNPLKINKDLTYTELRNIIINKNFEERPEEGGVLYIHKTRYIAFAETNHKRITKVKACFNYEHISFTSFIHHMKIKFFKFEDAWFLKPLVLFVLERHDPENLEYLIPEKFAPLLIEDKETETTYIIAPYYPGKYWFDMRLNLTYNFEEFTGCKCPNYKGIEPED